MNLIVDIVLFLFNIFNIVIHSAGCFLLVSIYKQTKPNNKRKRSPQQIYLINLSISEGLMNVVEAMRVILQYIPVSNEVSAYFEEIRHYLLIINFTGVWSVIYLSMVGITADRLLNILLHLRYPIYFNISKSKRLATFTWIIGIIICSCVSLTYKFCMFHWENFFFLYIYPIIDLVFIILGMLTYALIFQKYRRSYVLQKQIVQPSRLKRYKRASDKNAPEKPKSIFQVFIKSQFFIPVILILVFIIFVTIPDLVYLFCGMNAHAELKNKYLAWCGISYAVCNVVDAMVYVFLQQNVRQLLKKHLKNLVNKCCRQPYIHRFQE